jgi:hypothetical protein
MELSMPLGYCVGRRFECFNYVHSFKGMENLTDEIPNASETSFDEYYKDIVRPSLVATDSFQHTQMDLED